MVAVFISYAQPDQAVASQLVGSLNRKGVNVWFDAKEILVGDNILERIQSGLRSADYLVVLLSKNSQGSVWVQQEISSAYSRFGDEAEAAIIPVRIDDSPPPAVLQNIRYITLEEGLDAATSEIAARIERDHGKASLNKVIDTKDLAGGLAAERKISRGYEFYITSAVAIVGIIATLLVAWPSFDAYFTEKAKIYYDFRAATIAFPPGADPEKISKLLETIDIAPSGARIRIINKGRQAASEIKIGGTTSGQIRYVRSTPSAGSKSAWVSIAIDPISQGDKEFLVRAKDLVLNKVVLIDVGYEPADAKLQTDVVYNGILAERVPDIEQSPDFTFWAEFKLPIQIFFGALVASILSGFLLAALRNPRLRTMMLHVLRQIGLHMIPFGRGY